MNKNITKITVVAALSLLTLGGCASSTLAVTPSLATKVASRAAVVKDNVMDRLKTKADAEITRRLTTLGNVVTRLNNAQKLSSTDKTALLAQANTEISDLTNLKTKIDADADIATLRTDVKTITADYRVYRLIIPKMHLLIASSRVTDIAGEMNTVITELQTKIDAAKAAGQNVDSLQSQLDDAKSKVADAQAQSNTAYQALLPLTPDQYNANHSLLQTPRTELQTAHNDLVDARNTLKSIVQSLKTPASSAHPTATP